MLHDLETPLFTQKQLLTLLSGVKAKTLQNWTARGILDAGEQKPGRQGKRLYSPLDVIMIDFMARVSVYGVPPSLSREMANMIAEAALEFWAAKPVVTNPGGEHLWLSLTPENIDHFRRAYITVHAGQDGEVEAFMTFPSNFEDKSWRLVQGNIGIVYEVDYHTAMAINRIFLLQAGII